MSNDNPINPDQSELNQAVDKTDAKQIAENLKNTASANELDKQPENLTEEQKTPFIDDSVRTDK